MSVQLTDTKNLSLASLFGTATAIVGVLSEPSVLAIMPARIAAIVTVVGVIIAAISKALVHDAK